MAGIKIAYVGGGSTRAVGTIAKIVEQEQNFRGSQLVLIDLDPAKLEIVKRFADRLVRQHDAELDIVATIDRRAGLNDADVVLTSFRPGGFEARALDERIPLSYGVIGQETQGPGGFFMALRAIHVMKSIAQDVEAVCPDAWVINYTNPINIVAQALTHHTSLRTVSLCEGPLVFPDFLARAAEIDPGDIHAVMIGLNHACWSVEHSYTGEGDLFSIVTEAYERKRRIPTTPPEDLRLLRLASLMDAIPATYFEYYYFTDEILQELQLKPTTRAEDILAEVPMYWDHYEEQASADVPILDPARSRIGVDELELAIDVIDAIFNDRNEVLPVNVPNRGALPGFDDDVVVEVPGRVSARGITPIPQPRLPDHLLGLLEMLARYQQLAAEAAWTGRRKDGIRALAANPLVRSLEKAETIYSGLVAAHADYLPSRLAS